jgi:DNA-binding NtrC family response regulator
LIVLNGPDVSDWRPALSFQGSLFIEEAQDLNSSMQARLLRFLEERAFLPVTGRVMAGAAGRLFNRVRSGSFSPELFYRLNVIHHLIEQDISDR